MAAGDVSNHLGDEEGVVFGAVSLVYCIIAGFLLKCVKTADTGCNNHAHAVAVEIGCLFKLAVGNSLTSCHKSILRIQVELAQFLAVDMLCGVEILHFAGKLCLELRGVKMSDGSGTALACNGCGPCCGHIIAKRSDGAKACHDYSL